MNEHGSQISLFALKNINGWIELKEVIYQFWHERILYITHLLRMDGWMVNSFFLLLFKWEMRDDKISISLHSSFLGQYLSLSYCYLWLHFEGYRVREKERERSSNELYSGDFPISSSKPSVRKWNYAVGLVVFWFISRVDDDDETHT